MKLKKLSKKEFKTFADKNPEITFHQTEEWANLKKVNNWDAHYIGLEDDNKKIVIVNEDYIEENIEFSSYSEDEQVNIIARLESMTRKEASEIIQNIIDDISNMYDLV